MHPVVLCLFDIYCWFVFLVYLVGGFSFQGRFHLSYIGDLTRLGAIVGIALLAWGKDLSAISLVRGFADFQQGLVERRLPKTAAGRFVAFAMAALAVLFVLLPLIDYWGHHASGH